LYYRWLNLQGEQDTVYSMCNSSAHSNFSGAID
jgi:hypothetical protein